MSTDKRLRLSLPSQSIVKITDCIKIPQPFTMEVKQEIKLPDYIIYVAAKTKFI